MSEPLVTREARPETIEIVKDPPPPPLAKLRSLTRPSATVLDVGCGNGKVGVFLQAAGAVVDGIEPAQSRLEVARTRLRYVSDGWVSAGFDDPGLRDQYDVVAFLDVLEHMPDPVETLDWAVGRLAPGGAIFAMIPNSAHWSFRWKMLRGDWTYTAHGGLFDRTHLRFFSPETAALLRPSGLVEESRLYSSFGRLSHPRLVATRPRLFAMHTSFVWRAAS